MENCNVKTERTRGNRRVTARFFGYYLCIVVAGVLGLVVFWVAWCYATCPIYTFEEPKPFYGEKFYNPYQFLDPDGWHKCNFHTHAKSQNGMSDGKNTPEEVLAAYRRLKYDVVSISNHRSIDAAYSDQPFYIPVYEHGYGIKTTHLLALGAQKEVLRDYVLLQNLNQKQHVIDLLKQNCRLVALNHPSRRNAYLPEDFKWLSNYDFIELLSARYIVEDRWDTALSNGHKVWLLANDDAHSVKPGELQRNATFVNVFMLSGDAILERLAQGAAFGVRFPHHSGITWEEKIFAAEQVSFPIAIQVQEDTLHVVWQQKMQQIDFIGDHGTLLETLTDTDAAFYSIRPEDTYVRVRLTCPEGLVYYLNPVIRYAGDKLVRQSLHSVDVSRTLFKRTIIVLIVSGTLVGVCIIYVRTKKQKNFR